MPSTPLRGLFYGLIAPVLFSLCAAPLQAQQFQTNGHAFNVTGVPAWADWSELRDKPGKRPGMAIAYRLVDRQVHIRDQGETRFTRIVTQPLTEAGLREASVIEVSFNPAFQTLAIHKLQLLRNGKVIDKLRPKDVRLMQREEDFDNKLFDGILTATVILDDVRLNDSIDLAYSIEGRNPVFGNKHFSAFALGWRIPVDLARVRVSVPAKRKLYTHAINTKIKPDKQRRNGRVEYQWSLTDTVAVIDEDNAPTWHQPYPGIQITEYKRWRDVSDWATSLYVNGGELPAELRNTLRQWRTQESDKKQLVTRALKLVQDEVRYFGIEIGQNSHRPHLPGEVYERRYGDCKDKTWLLVAMLDELGIESHPALVSTDYQRDIDNWLPSPGLFDHVIVTTKLDGKRYWLDGTRNYQQGTIDALAVPDFERALIIRRGENRLVPIELDKTAVSGIDIKEEFRITDYNSPVTLAVITTYRGAHAEALREYFATTTPDAIGRSYMNYYAKIYPSISSLGPVTSHNDPTGNRFTTEERYSVEGFWEAHDEGKYAFLFGSTIAPYIKKPDSVRRSSPLAITHPVAIRHSSTLIYPEDIDYTIDEPEIAVEDPFVSYRRAISYNDRKLTVTHDYNSRKDAIMPAQLQDYFANINKISETLKYSTWISDHTEQTGVNAMVDTLLNRLDHLSSK